MNKRAARQQSRERNHTAVEMRLLVSEYGGGNMPSRINKQFSKSDIAKIYRDGLASYPDDYIFDPYNGRDSLFVSNILRECG